MNIITQKEKVKLTFESFKPHKVYQSLFDGNFYTLAKLAIMVTVATTVY